jgi:hypothetical protein
VEEEPAVASPSSSLDIESDQVKEPDQAATPVPVLASERTDGRFVPHDLDNLSLVALQELETFHHDGLLHISNAKVRRTAKQGREEERLSCRVCVCAHPRPTHMDGYVDGWMDMWGNG